MTVAVFFGGKSCEHDISIITAMQALASIDKSKYKVIPVYIGRDGTFFTGRGMDNPAAFRRGCNPSLRKVHLRPSDNSLYRGAFRIARLDAAVICCHGLGGEDGTLQGYLEMAGIPYTSCGVLSSAVGMDKIIMKMVFSADGLPVLPFVWTQADAYAKEAEEFLTRAEKELGYPMIVKPSNLGSSIGISKAKNRAELSEAIDVALNYDVRVLVERAVTQITEVNCSALQKNGEVSASVVEQPVSWEEFLTFDEKYLTGGAKSEGMASLRRKIPAEISVEMTEKVKGFAARIYKLLGCNGVVRVDYIIDNATGEIFVNEINTIPGSLSYYLWDYDGMEFCELIDVLINGAVYAEQKRAGLTFGYDSPVLFASSGKGSKG